MSPETLSIPKDTPLVPLEELARRFRIKNLYLKDESANPFGTIKDRRSFRIVTEAASLHVDKLALITSGNNGYSLGRYAKAFGIDVTCIVDRHLKDETKRALRSVCYQVAEINLHHRILRPEEVVAYARERDDEVIWDATNGYEDAYGTIWKEIKKLKPTHVVVPVGSGGIYTGLVQAIRKSKMPTKVLGVGVRESYASFADKLHTPWTPYARTMAALEKEGNRIYRLSEHAVRETYREFGNACDSEPSSAIVFGIFKAHVFSPKDTVVLVNSGRSKQ